MAAEVGAVTGKSQLARVRALAQRRLAVSWVVAFGIALLWIFLSPGDEPGQVGFAVMVMALYWWYGTRVSEKNTAKFADSLYFMGFLLTLAALIGAVIVRGGQLGPKDVFKAFGYALITTGVGMFLRVLVLQFQETLPDRVADAREGIEQWVRALRDELREASRAAARFRTRVEKDLDQELRALVGSVDSIRAAIEEAHARAAETSLSSLQSAVAALVHRLSEFELPTDVVEREGARLVEAVERVGAEIHGAASALATELRAYGSALDGAFTDMAEQLRRSDTSLRGISDRLQESTGAMASAFSSLESTVRSLVHSFKRVTDETLSSVSSSRTQLDRAAGQVLETVRLALDAHAKSAEALRDIQGQLDSAVSSLSQTVGLLDRLPGGVQQFVERFSTISMEVHHRLTAETARMREAVQAAKESASELDSAVGEVLDFVRERLRERGVD